MVDSHKDGLYDPEVNRWGNRFSNETALFRSSDGGMVRINEFRRCSAGESRLSIYGVLGTYQEQPGAAAWQGLEREARENDSHVRDCPGIEITEENLGDRPRQCLGRKFLGVSPVHPVDRLPGEFLGLPTGHAGSHQFLVVDFLEAVARNRLPPNHVWAAARYNAPGIVAHESARREGERLAIPDFGAPPAGWTWLDPADPFVV
jgi:hypothetical protein